MRDTLTLRYTKLDGEGTWCDMRFSARFACVSVGVVGDDEPALVLRQPGPVPDLAQRGVPPGRARQHQPVREGGHQQSLQHGGKFVIKITSGVDMDTLNSW